MSCRHIPPIQCLVTFEAVARLKSASRAADELWVTVSAVSRGAARVFGITFCGPG